MPNDSRTLFQAFQKKGLSDREALFAILDHHAQLHCFDRNHYAQVAEELRAENAQMKELLAALERR